MAIKKGDASRPKEPQSYGSEKDWLTGDTDQEVNGTASGTDRHDEEFYEPRHNGDDSPGDTGGKPARESYEADPADRDTSDVPTTDQPPRVSDTIDGRKSYFKKRDYGE